MMDTSILDHIGNTPLVRVHRLLPEEAKHARVLVKLEMQNPGGSLKDRIAMSIIRQAEDEGKLAPGGTVVEATSGNTGIGLAMVCAAKGYQCILVMLQKPANRDRYMICRQFGAEVHMVTPARGYSSVIEHYNNILADNPTYFGANQYQNPNNPSAHSLTTGPEVWNQAGEQVDYFIHGIGTGGTLCGVGEFLRSKNPAVKIIGVEPSVSRIHTNAPYAMHAIPGIGPDFVSHFFDTSVRPPQDAISLQPWGGIDEWACATNEEAIDWAQRAARDEGIMCGPSAGASLKVAVDIASRTDSAGKTIVVILASHGIRYTNHPLWGDIKEEAVQACPDPPNMDQDAELCLWKSPANRK